MLIQCDREKFSQAFNLAASVAAVRDVKPVLQNVKLTVRKDGAVLMATDSESSVRVPVAGLDVKEPGEIILPTRQVKRILSESRVETFQIKTDKDKMVISGSGFQFKLDSQDTGDFPEVEDFNEKAYHTIPAKIMRELIKRTVYAVDAESTRYTLGGVLLDLQEGVVDAVATDGRRLSYQTAAAEAVNDHQTEKSAIFPIKMLQLIERACGGDEAEVQLAVSDNKAIFKLGGSPGIVLSTRLIEGRFPRWRSIIPDEAGKAKIDIIAGAILSAVRQAAIVTSDKTPGVVFSFSDGKLELHGQGAEIGESDIEVPVVYSGSSLQVKLDPAFIEDFLRTLEPETVVSVYVSENDPILFQTEDKYTYVVMPLT